jgi:DNA-binding transcriptional MerR regulator
VSGMDSDEDDGPRSSRKYLALGELLEVLRVDYPDLTVSKIRFLEQQGLLTPERTPSGYRKFYAGHVDRLRWILEQQEGTYLPLREIKTRLLEAEAEGRFTPLTPDFESTADVFESGDEGVNQYRSAPPAALGERRHPAGLFRSLADDLNAQVATPPVPAEPAPPARPPLRVVARGRDAKHTPITDRMAKEATASHGHSEPVAAKSTAAKSGASTAASTSGAASTARPAGAASAMQIGTSPEVDQMENERAANAGEPKKASLTREPSISLSFAELVAQSGCSADDVKLLEQYGLLMSRQVLGKSYYDEDALAAAQVAAQMAAFGVEARHLRLYRNAVDRESDFYLQVVSPLIYRREERSREQAAANLVDLQRLGAALREATLRQVLRSALEPK